MLSLDQAATVRRGKVGKMSGLPTADIGRPGTWSRFGHGGRGGGTPGGMENNRLHCERCRWGMGNTRGTRKKFRHRQARGLIRLDMGSTPLVQRPQQPRQPGRACTPFLFQGLGSDLEDSQRTPTGRLRAARAQRGSPCRPHAQLPQRDCRPGSCLSETAQLGKECNRRQRSQPSQEDNPCTP